MADEEALAVDLKEVVKTYGHDGVGVTALRGVNLEVRPGELMMLVGPSGCGKTTLLSVVAGILDQDSGASLVFGRDMESMSPDEKTRYRGRTIGFVFQTFNLLPSLTAAENVAVPLLINGTPRRRAVAQASEVLERVGLEGRMRSLPSQLSGGEQQRVAIARAMVHDPKLILCDEPTSALDNRTGHKVLELMRSVVMTAGRSMIIVTHDNRILSFADRIATMEDGRIHQVHGADEHVPDA